MMTWVRDRLYEYHRAAAKRAARRANKKLDEMYGPNSGLRVYITETPVTDEPTPSKHEPDGKSSRAKRRD